MMKLKYKHHVGIDSTAGNVPYITTMAEATGKHSGFSWLGLLTVRDGELPLLNIVIIQGNVAMHQRSTVVETDDGYTNLLTAIECLLLIAASDYLEG